MSPALCLHASSESDADLLYATGFHAPDPVLWFRKGRRSHLLVPQLELGRARATARVDEVLDYTAARARLAKRLGRPPKYAEVAVAVLRAKRVSAVTVPERFPLATADALRQAGIAVTVREGAYFPERLVKRPEEVEAIRTAQRATERAVHKALDVLREAKPRRGLLYHRGERVTSELLKAVVDVELMREGCVAKHTIVASGEQCVDPHDTGSGPIRPNTSVIFDVFPRHAASGYFADMSRTVVRGRASRELREIYELVEAGQEHAFARVRAGANGQEIHRGVQELFDAAGWETGPTGDGRMQGFFHGTGHGVGLDVHEPPGIGLKDDVLPEGAVVTVEPGLYYPGIGGVRLEDMVLVTATGCESLTDFPKQLEL